MFSRKCVAARTADIAVHGLQVTPTMSSSDPPAGDGDGDKSRKEYIATAEEIEHRRNLRETAAATGPQAPPPTNAALTRRKGESYCRTHKGWWVVNFANIAFSTPFPRPNIRILRLCKTEREAKAACMEFMNHPGVTSVPVIVPANTPFMIPYSEAAAVDSERMHVKLARNMQRHANLAAYRDEDFASRREGKSEGYLGLSHYHRRKTLLAKRAAEEAVLAAAMADTDAERAEKEAAAAAALEVARQAESVPVPPDEIMAKLRAVPPDVVRAAETTGRGKPTPAPLIPTEALPERWKGLAPLEQREWPRDLEVRGGGYCCIGFADDLDEPSDDPAYPAEAAGAEPIVVIFGTQFAMEALADKHAKDDISTWCNDFPIDVVNMYDWLDPTNVDPDNIDSKHKAGSATETRELNRIQNRRRANLQEAAKARAENTPATLPETNALRQDLPDLSAAVRSTRAPVGAAAAAEQGPYDPELAATLRNMPRPPRPPPTA
jgi:hypothetical protein